MAQAVLNWIWDLLYDVVQDYVVGFFWEQEPPRPIAQATPVRTQATKNMGGSPSVANPFTTVHIPTSRFGVDLPPFEIRLPRYVLASSMTHKSGNC